MTYLGNNQIFELAIWDWPWSFFKLTWKSHSLRFTLYDFEGQHEEWMLLGVSIFQQVFVFGFWNPLTPFCSSKKCQIVRESHRFEESDLLGQVDDLQGENVFFLLNVDGSLPFPGVIKEYFWELNIAEPWSTIYSHDAEIELEKNNKLTTFPLFPLQCTMSPLLTRMLL